MTVQQCIALYQDYLCDRIAEWKELPNETLYDWEHRLSSYSHFINANREQQAVCLMRKITVYLTKKIGKQHRKVAQNRNENPSSSRVKTM